MGPRAGCSVTAMALASPSTGWSNAVPPVPGSTTENPSGWTTRSSSRPSPSKSATSSSPPSMADDPRRSSFWTQTEPSRCQRSSAPARVEPVDLAVAVGIAVRHGRCGQRRVQEVVEHGERAVFPGAVVLPGVMGWSLVQHDDVEVAVGVEIGEEHAPPGPGTREASVGRQAPVGTVAVVAVEFVAGGSDGEDIEVAVVVGIGDGTGGAGLVAKNWAGRPRVVGLQENARAGRSAEYDVDPTVVVHVRPEAGGDLLRSAERMHGRRHEDTLATTEERRQRYRSSEHEILNTVTIEVDGAQGGRGRHGQLQNPRTGEHRSLHRDRWAEPFGDWRQPPPPCVPCACRRSRPSAPRGWAAGAGTCRAFDRPVRNGPCGAGPASPCSRRSRDAGRVPRAPYQPVGRRFVVAGLEMGETEVVGRVSVLRVEFRNAGETHFGQFDLA